MIHRPFIVPLDDGERIVGDLRMPDGPPPRSAVVVVHGFKGFKDWGFFPHVCEVLAGDGHAVVSFNFSLNGIGDDPESFTRLEAFGRNTFSREVDELLRIVHELRDGELLPGPVRRIGLLGHSRGGGVAILAAREDAEGGGGDPAVRAVATWSAVASFDRWAEETKSEWREEGRIYVMNARTGQQMPLEVGLLEDFEASRDRLDVERAAADLSAPLLVVHGEEDLAVSAEDARRLARANPEARLELVAGAGHTFEARHPFEGSTPELDRALAVTRRHFARHLLDEGGGDAPAR